MWKISDIWGLVKCGILFDSGDHGVDYIGKCSDETVIKICKSYECLDISNACRGLPILNSFNFLGSMQMSLVEIINPK